MLHNTYECLEGTVLTFLGSGLIFCVSCVPYQFFSIKVKFYALLCVCALPGKVVPEMTYFLLSGTLNLFSPTHSWRQWYGRSYSVCSFLAPLAHGLATANAAAGTTSQHSSHCLDITTTHGLSTHRYTSQPYYQKRFSLARALNTAVSVQWAGCFLLSGLCWFMIKLVIYIHQVADFSITLLKFHGTLWSLFSQVSAWSTCQLNSSAKSN